MEFNDFHFLLSINLGLYFKNKWLIGKILRTR